MSSHRIIIEAGKTERNYWRDIWIYRELFFFLSWRDILVRYKQTAIGVLWAIIRPILAAVIFTFIFGKFAGMPSDGMPYLLFVFAAMLPWQFFSTSLSEGSNSLISNANMVSKVYFPRLVMPVSTVVVNVVDFLLSFVILLALMAWERVMPSWHMLVIPPFLFLAFLASSGVSFWLSALNVQYRDFRYIVPFIVQFGLYVSPVVFSSSVVPDKWRLAYSLNPMVAIIDGFRWAISGGKTPFLWSSFGISVGATLALLISGLAYFRKMEQRFADVI